IFIAVSLMVFFAAFDSSNTPKKEDNSRKFSFNEQWDFYLSDSTEVGDSISDQIQWRTLELPHDWSIEGSFNPQSPVGHGGGYLSGGLGWYKKDFIIVQVDESKRISILLYGVYYNS